MGNNSNVRKYLKKRLGKHGDEETGRRKKRVCKNEQIERTMRKQEELARQKKKVCKKE